VFNVQKLFLQVYVPAMYMCILGECRTLWGEHEQGSNA